ncbi:hypothetical protein BXZ70DRAFT_940429 [Cristinia sonorae]|uniref:Uncharacterized protein n=1 Tax=Cristinia sonorae TaxID=1940300 RepID=A0A8K0XPZ2_9AGAR|nr:hypothetical protein BXZ70DRAFT_940429 [Cristinia sonorae]
MPLGVDKLLLFSHVSTNCLFAFTVFTTNGNPITTPNALLETRCFEGHGIDIVQLNSLEACQWPPLDLALDCVIGCAFLARQRSTGATTLRK